MVEHAVRHRELLNLEGWYSIKPTRPHYAEYIQSGSRRKYTRWLSEMGYNASQVITESFDCKLSCRHKDLLRVLDSKHYTSCLNTSFSIQVKLNLADPDLAIVFVPDRGGNFKLRAFVRLCLEGLLFYNFYGNGDNVAILNHFNGIIPVYIIGYSDNIDLHSATSIRNHHVQYPQCHDASWIVEHNRLTMKGKRLCTQSKS